MKTLVIGGNKGFWNYKEQINSDYDINGVENWAFAMQGDYICGNDITLELINQYELVLCNLNFDMTIYMEKANSIIRNRNSNVKWASLIENDALVYLNAMHKVKNLMDNADLLISINTQSQSFFKFMTTTKVELIGIPYNLERVLKLRKPIENRNNKIIVLSSPYNRINDFLVADKSGKDYSLLIPTYSRNLQNLLKVYKKHKEISLDKSFHLNKIEKMLNKKIENFHYTTTLSRFLEILSNQYLALNLDERYTWSRNVLDCAALGIPIISTKNTEHTNHLFPELMVENCFALDEALELTNRLYSDSEFYKKQSEPNIDYLEQFTYNKIQNKLLNAIGNSSNNG